MATKDQALRTLVAIYQGRLAVPQTTAPDAPPVAPSAPDAPWAQLTFVALADSQPGAAGAKDPVAGRAGRDLALSTLWLALWRALDSVRTRYTRSFVSQEEIVSSLSSHMLRLVSELDLPQVSRVAAGIVRGVERDLHRELQSGWSRSRMHDELDEQSTDLPCDPFSELPPPSSGFERHVHQLVDSIRPAVGDDAGLLVAVLALGEEPAAAGAAIGIGREAAYKRVQRGSRALRASFAQAMSN